MFNVCVGPGTRDLIRDLCFDTTAVAELCPDNSTLVSELGLMGLNEFIILP
jgi:hypothetical protein